MGKRGFLEAMLTAIDISENCNVDRRNLPAFASQTTLEGWRLSILSTIGLTEELLYPKDPEDKYDFFLTAKVNQDHLEVLFQQEMSQLI